MPQFNIDDPVDVAVGRMKEILEDYANIYDQF